MRAWNKLAVVSNAVELLALCDQGNCRGLTFLFEVCAPLVGTISRASSSLKWEVVDEHQVQETVLAPHGEAAKKDEQTCTGRHW